MKKNEDLIKYWLNFIEVNVLKLFKRKELNENQRDILKYNIETVLKIFGKDKNTYRNYYHPEARFKTKVVNRGKSIEALKKFRKEFSISDKEYTDEGLLNRLIKNIWTFIKPLKNYSVFKFEIYYFTLISMKTMIYLK